MIPRKPKKALCYWLKEGKPVFSSWDEIEERFGTREVIRIHIKDYPFIPQGELFTHFNMEVSGHEIGRLYLLPKIIKPGYFIDEKDTRPPLLDFQDCFLARCLSVREQVLYSSLTPEDFRYSLANIQNVPELQKEILWRYKQSLPAYSKKDILSRGVSVTDLQIIKRNS